MSYKKCAHLIVIPLCVLAVGDAVIMSEDFNDCLPVCWRQIPL